MLSIVIEISILLLILILIYINKPRNKYLSMILYGIWAWVFSIFLTDGNVIWGNNYYLALYSSRFSFITAIFLFYFILLMIINIKNSYIEQYSKFKKVLQFILILTIVPGVINTYNSFTDGIVESIEFVGINIRSTMGEFYGLFVLMYGILYLLIIVLIIIQLIKTRNLVVRQQMNYILIG